MISKLYRLFTKNWLFLTIALVSLIRLGSFDDHSLSLFAAYPYALSYQEFGFGSRFLIGSIIRLFFDRFLEMHAIRLVYFAVLASYIIAALLMQRIYTNAKEEDRKPYLAVCAVIMFSPIASQFLHEHFFGRLELFLQIATLIMLFLASRRFLIWLVPIFCVISVAIYQNFVFFYFAPLFTILIYKAVTSEKKVVRAKIITVISLSVLLTCSSSYVFQFCKDINASSAQEMRDRLEEYTDIPMLLDRVLEEQAEWELQLQKELYENPDAIPSDPEFEIEVIDDPLRLEYFLDMEDHLGIYFLDQTGDFYWTIQLKRFLYTVLYLSPLIAILVLFYRRAAKNEESKAVKWVYRLAMLSPLTAVPTFLLTVDYGRWIAALFFTQFVLMLFLIYKLQSAKDAIASLYAYVVKYPVGFIVLLLYLNALGYFLCIDGLNMTQVMMST
jgi:hypothetical protein